MSSTEIDILLEKCGDVVIEVHYPAGCTQNENDEALRDRQQEEAAAIVGR